MNINYVKSYVYHYASNFFSIGLVRQMIFVFVFMTMLGSVFGIVGRGSLMMITFFLLGITVLYTIFALILPLLWKSSEFSHRFIVNGICATFMAIFFFVFTLIFVFMETNTKTILRYVIFMIIVSFISVVASFSLTLRNVETGKFAEKEKKRKEKRKKVEVVVVGVSFGILFGRIFLLGLEQNMAISVAVIMGLFLTCICIYGTTNFLKAHFIRKYTIQGDGMEGVIEKQLHPPKKKKGK